MIRIDHITIYLLINALDLSKLAYSKTRNNTKQLEQAINRNRYDFKK